MHLIKESQKDSSSHQITNSATNPLPTTKNAPTSPISSAHHFKSQPLDAQEYQTPKDKDKDTHISAILLIQCPLRKVLFSSPTLM
jgi:hypothetical protein